MMRHVLIVAIVSVAVAGDAAAAHRPNRHLSTSPLTLAAPQPAAPLLSDIPATLRPSCTYTGTGNLTYALQQGPQGMAIDAVTGVMTWTPPAAMEGQQAQVALSASDGAVTATASFVVAVASTTQITTSVAGGTITVTAPGTLQGLGLTLPAGATLPPAQVKVSTVSAGQAPALPDGVTRVSDYFRVTPVNGGTDLITLALPTAHVPAGRSPQDVRLFVYSDAAGNVDAGGDIGGLHWIRTWYAFDMLPSGMATIKLQAVGDLAFIGVDAPATAPPTPAAATAFGTVQVGATAVTIVCTPFAFVNGLPAIGIQVCSLTGDVTLTVVVKQFSRLKANPAATLNEVLGWLAAARKEFTALGLGSDASLEVVFETMPKPTWGGFVTTRNLENCRVLHITDASIAKPLIQGTVAHEYFHHAQSRTRIGGYTNLIDTNLSGDWLIEGTARWFEDHLFDSLDTYRTANRSPLPQILTWGLAATPDDTVPETNAYNRHAFWKMVKSSCTAFTLPAILNCNTAGDPACLANFRSKVESDEWQCDFGAGFGPDNVSSLASALLYYTHATVQEDKMSLLDGDEPYSAFDRARGWERLASSAACTSFATCPAGSTETLGLRCAAAVPFEIAAVPSLDPGEGAMVEVKSENGGELWVWVGNAEQPGGLANGTWTKTTASWSNLYAPSGRAPKTLVVVVNPDPVNDVNVSIRAGRAQTLYIYPDIDARVWAPIFGWGCPEADYTLVARTLVDFPDHYRMVWEFGDGSPEVTVDDDPTVEHAWDDVGDHTVTLKLYEMPAKTLVAQTTGTAHIKYFAGRYRLDQFSGTASGVIGDPYAQWVLQFVPMIQQHPDWAFFDWSEWSDSEDAAFTTVPPDGDANTWLIGLSDSFSPGTADCPSFAEVVGNTYSGQFCAGSTDTQCILCLSSTAAQTGTQLNGTFGYWTKYFSCSGTPQTCTPINQGQGSYTFHAAYAK